MIIEKYKLSENNFLLFFQNCYFEAKFLIFNLEIFYFEIFR
jgi:hypothetical protein